MPPRCQCEVDEFNRLESERIAKEEQARIDRYYGVFQMPVRFRDRTIENFKPDTGSSKAYDAIKGYIATIHQRLDEGAGAFLLGTNGNGKTHLAASVYHAARATNETAVFVVVADMLKLIKSTFDENSRFTEWQLTDPLMKARLVILDDLGQEKMTDWAREKLFTVINHRYENRKSTIVTSNRDPDEIADRIGKASFDRVIGHCRLIEITSESKRWTEALTW